MPLIERARLGSIASNLVGAAPALVKDAVVTVASSRLHRMRRSGVYKIKLAEQRRFRGMRRSDLKAVQGQRLRELVDYAQSRSAYYRRRYEGLAGTDLSRLPVLEKDDLQGSIDEIVIGDKTKLAKSFTGGTTGKALTVYNENSNFQERAAIMDLFWEDHGFRLGRDRVAWFSGRSLIWENDVRARRFWRNNWLYKIRYYSTFHMSQENLAHYVRDLDRFQPAFMSGFPSAISEVARYLEGRGLRPAFRPQAIFVTSEMLDRGQRELITRVFGCPVRDQYSASEGAPFILECREGRLHMDITSGVFEVIDEGGQPSNEGEMLVTCFITRQTPLIRYRIGDRLKLSPEEMCPCGWDTPLAEAIQGRLTDYIEVPDRGRIFNAQIGDCVKDITTVLKFQVKMTGGRLQVYMVADPVAFEAHDKAKFLKKVAERVGHVPIDLHYVDDIPRSPSGKHTLVRRTEVTLVR